jgi:hypothetical protein
MASSSNTTTIPSSFSIRITEKLAKTNYLLWRLQFMPVVRAAQLEYQLYGVKKMPPKTLPIKMGETVTDQPNLDYIACMTHDQALLGYLMPSVTREVLMGPTTITTSTAAWTALAEMFAPRTHVQFMNTRIALATTKKVTSTMADFFSKMKTYADEMVAFGQPLGDEEFVSYILMGLDEELYNAFVSSIIT